MRVSVGLFAAKAAPTILLSTVGAALRTGCTYVAEHMDVRERPAANDIRSGRPAIGHDYRCAAIRAQAICGAAFRARDFDDTE